MTAILQQYGLFLAETVTVVLATYFQPSWARVWATRFMTCCSVILELTPRPGLARTIRDPLRFFTVSKTFA